MRGSIDDRGKEHADNHSLPEGGKTSDVVEPATGESVIGLALTRAATSAAGTKETGCILVILTRSSSFNEWQLKSQRAVRGWIKSEPGHLPCIYV